MIGRLQGGKLPSTYIWTWYVCMRKRGISNRGGGGGREIPLLLLQSSLYRISCYSRWKEGGGDRKGSAKRKKKDADGERESFFHSTSFRIYLPVPYKLLRGKKTRQDVTSVS